jgi:hypothetical protein
MFKTWLVVVPNFSLLYSIFSFSFFLSFPFFKNNNNQSGHYMPTLAKYIVDSGAIASGAINFKGGLAMIFIF